MAGIDIGEISISIELATEKSDELVRSRPLDEQFIDTGDDAGQWQCAMKLDLQRPLSHGSEQRGCNALSRNVAENEDRSVVADRNQIVKVASDITRRNAEGRDAEMRRLIETGRRERDLNLACHVQFAFETLLLLLLVHQADVFERLSCFEGKRFEKANGGFAQGSARDLAVNVEHSDDVTLEHSRGVHILRHLEAT